MKYLLFSILAFVAISTAVVYFELELPFGIGQGGIGDTGAEAVRTVATAVQAELRPETPTPAPAVPTPIPTLAPVPTTASVPTAAPAAPTPAPTPQPANTPYAAPTPTLADMIESVKPGLVFIEPLSGSGFVIDESGLVVTNQHVVEGLDTVTVWMLDGREYGGVVLGVDEIADLAVVQLVSSDKFEFMDLGNSNDVRVGDEVIALGFPWRFELGTEPTITKGIISSNRIHNGVDVLQTDAAINPGNSGGPLLNRHGDVIGVNYAKHALMHEVPVDNIGFSIAVDELHRRLEFLISGENDRIPIPTPAPWTVYENSEYGYSLEIAPDWYLEQENQEGVTAFWSGDYSGSIGIFAENLSELGFELSIDEYAEAVLLGIEEQALDESWAKFEITYFEKQQGELGEYYRMGSISQLSDEYCVQDNFTLIFLSDLYPTDPYGFVLAGSVCEESFDIYGEEIASMLDSFVH